MRTVPLVLLLALGCLQAEVANAAPIAPRADAVLVQPAAPDDDFFLCDDDDDIVGWDTTVRNHGAAMRAAAPSALIVLTDADSDGYYNTSDCNDNNSSIYPGAVEVVGDGVDQDCNGGELCFPDGDGDGYGVNVGSVASADLSCAQSGESARSDDCNDVNNTTLTGSDIHPGAAEVAGDGVDQDCDGLERCYVDEDGDGYAGIISALGDDLDCVDPGEYAVADDCQDFMLALDDTVPLDEIHPGAPEVCNEIDDDCDGHVDDDDDDRVGLVWRHDGDGDGFGAGTGVVGCTSPGDGYVVGDLDCDDDDDAIHPGATEIPGNDVDEDCVADEPPDDTDVVVPDDTDDGGGDSDVIGDTPTDDEPEGGACDKGCSTGGAPRPGGLVALAGLLGLVARRRRR